MDKIPDCRLHGERLNHYLEWFPVNLVRNALTFSHALTGTPMYPYGFSALRTRKVIFFIWWLTNG